jgi:putative SOS response-associated peptidase YedK
VRHRRRRGAEARAVAGLWAEWRPPAAPDGEALRTCAIVTCAPNALMARYHHRMPVILAPEAEGAWLDPRVEDPAGLLPLLAPYPADPMTAYPVSPAVNSPANDSPQLVLPL